MTRPAKRPPRNRPGMPGRITISLGELEEPLRKAAYEQKRKKSEIIREALMEYLNKQSKSNATRGKP